MQNGTSFPRALCASLLTLAAACVCGAQTIGYVEGTSSLTSFNVSTGAVVNSFASGGAGTAFAVAGNDVTLYITTAPINDAGVLNVVSGQSGETLDTLSLGLLAPKVVLSSDGSKAYINAAGETTYGGPGQVIVVETATLAVSGSLTMRFGQPIQDIALSPDNTTLYVAVTCTNSFPNCNGTSGACPLASGLCIFNASTLALEGTVEKLTGYLAVSQDNRSLYVTEYRATLSGLHIMNTSTLSVTTRNLPAEPNQAAVVNPAAGYAVVFIPESSQSSTTAYILNTSTNKFVGELFVNGPYGAQVGANVALVPVAFAAFAPDGKSLWMIMSCEGVLPSCTLPSQRSLVGVSFPSGALIGTATALPNDATSIAFPQ
jgi:hypothetical protein